jgi:3-oxoadipate enol-lactonase / 4-carboxymuconolactone decarboxylase
LTQDAALTQNDSEKDPDMTLMHHRLTGPGDAPVVVLANSLGTSLEMWDPQLATLSQHFRILRYDQRGHGGSPTPDGPYSLADLGTDVLELLDHHGMRKVSFVGLSLGGMVGMWLAAHHGDRVDRLVLCCTAPWFPTEPWLSRAAKVRSEGTGSLETMLLERWFTPRTLSEQPEVCQGFGETLAAVSDEGYASCCDAIATMDLRPDLARIEAPTMLVFGALDPATPPETGELIRQGIDGAGLVVVPQASHLANVEQPGAVTRAVMNHLTGDPLERGLATRRAVLGDAYVDRALTSASDLTAPFQEILTRFAWGDVWSRPSLPIETRRLLTIALLAGLGRHEELELHIRAALTAGLAQESLRETLLQTAVYAGVPAANSAFAVATRVLAELEAGAS